jgi:hypothetical protein
MGSSRSGFETAWLVGYRTIVLLWANATPVNSRQHVANVPLREKNFLARLTDFLLEETLLIGFP